MIAQAILGDPPHNEMLGEVTLHPHQSDAAHRLRTTLARTHGALLCDEVGLGKTFTALAVARHYPHTLIIAPATLRPMWQDATRRTGIRARIASTESLSQGHTPAPAPLVIVDEAHAFRSQHTKRYERLAQLCAHAHVICISATPIHNHRHDLLALAALFMGERAESLANDELAHLIVRRTHQHVPTPRPRVTPTRWHTISSEVNYLDAILALPPPAPIESHQDAHHLVTHTLIRQWASSDAALRAALTRRLGKASALLESLAAGHCPTKHDMHTWLVADDAIQLSFPELAPIAPTHVGDMTRIVRQHADAVRTLRDAIPTRTPADVQRAQVLTAIRQRHPDAKIVAFSQYAETIRALHMLMRTQYGVAALTARGGFVGHQRVSTHHVLTHFAPIAHHAPRPPYRDDITYLLTTDRLSEGTNLQDASVVIHLDLPWTEATLRQRVGRVARMTSTHHTVTVAGLRPPQSANRYLHAMTTILRKGTVARATIGATNRASTSGPNASRRARTTLEAAESIRDHLGTWRQATPVVIAHEKNAVPYAVVRARYAAHTKRALRPAALALCTDDGVIKLIALSTVGAPTDHPHKIAATLKAASDYQTSHDDARYHEITSRIYRWAETRQSERDAGLDDDAPHLATPKLRTALRALATYATHLPFAQRLDATRDAVELRETLAHARPWHTHQHALEQTHVPQQARGTHQTAPTCVRVVQPLPTPARHADPEAHQEPPIPPRVSSNPAFVLHALLILAPDD